VNGIREELSGIGGTFKMATEHRIRQDELRLAEREAEKAFRLAEREAEKAIRLAEIEAEKALKLAEKDGNKAERSKARQLLQRQESYLDFDALSTVVDLFNDHPILGETYIELETPGLRRAWIAKLLLKHGHPLLPSSEPPE
jgi:hypothetical protein